MDVSNERGMCLSRRFGNMGELLYECGHYDRRQHRRHILASVLHTRFARNHLRHKQYAGLCAACGGHHWSEPRAIDTYADRRFGWI